MSAYHVHFLPLCVVATTSLKPFGIKMGTKREEEKRGEEGHRQRKKKRNQNTIDFPSLLQISGYYFIHDF